MMDETLTQDIYGSGFHTFIPPRSKTENPIDLVTQNAYEYLLTWLRSCVLLIIGACGVLVGEPEGLLARSQYSEGPATVHLDTGFSWFPCVYKQMLR